MLSHLFTIAVVALQVCATPVQLYGTPFSPLRAREAVDISSFIALGESYATGVGAGVPDESVLTSRCLRYNQSYPRVLAHDNNLQGPADGTRLINNACSGQTIPQIVNTQFNDTDSRNFAAFGQPQFATISAAGDDIEFKELVLSCIYEFPYKPKKCQDQIARSNALLEAPAFIGSIVNLVETTLNKGLVNHKDFRIYYLLYAQFFNDKETSPDFCSQKSWSRCKFWQRGCEKLPLTIDLRQQLNQLAAVLNAKIFNAVSQFTDTVQDGNGKPLVKYVNMDDLMQGHRYCEQGKQEPVNNDDDIWFFQWLDDESTNDDGKHEFYNMVANRLTNAPNVETLQDNSLSGSTSFSAEDFLQASIEVANANPVLASSIEAEGAITNKVKTFHPKSAAHGMIEQRLLALVQQDYAVSV